MIDVLVALSIFTTPLKPPCEIVDTCKYLPDYNGPILPTWDAPGYYGGWNSGQPILCDPFTQTCRGVAPE